jgi:hypothetical protein
LDRRSLLKGAILSAGSRWALQELSAQGRQEAHPGVQQGGALDLAKEIQRDTVVDLAKLRNARWDERRAFQYMQRFGEVKGCNYVPSDGSSILHLPNEELIRRELGWAHDVVGLNCVRVWIGLVEYQVDPEGVMKNFDNFLQVCDENQIKVLPVLSIQQMLDPDYTSGTPEANKPDADRPLMNFLPSVHGGGRGGRPGRLNWTCCEPEGSIPPKTIAAWAKVRPAAEQFVRTVLSRYAKDERIILWDLYNEAPKAARPLVELVFQWAREINPSQPLSVCWQGHDLSDVITFHSYGRPGFETANRNSMGWDFLTELDWARAWGRPMLCTEWLARPFGNTIEAILPFYERYHIGWFVWGLCAVGPAQYQFPWGWPMGSPPPEKWFHCLLYPDGTPYSAEEILMIRDFKYRQVTEQVKTQSYWQSWNADINTAERYEQQPRAASITATRPGSNSV